MTMTKKESTQLARGALQHGHFRVNTADARARCPRCQRDVILYAPTPSRPATHGQMVAALAQEIRDCDDGHCNLWTRP